MTDMWQSGVKRDDEWHAKQDIINDGDAELEAKIYRRLKRSPIPFEVLQEKLDLDASVLRALLMKLGEDGLAEINPGFGWQRKPKPKRLTKAQALGIVLEAAASWANELGEYIIPADAESDEEDAMASALGGTDNMNAIYEAVKLLTPKEKS